MNEEIVEEWPIKTTVLWCFTLCVVLYLLVVVGYAIYQDIGMLFGWW